MKATSNISDADERLLSELKKESVFISESLMGRGYPDGWVSANVQKIGLTDGRYILNTTKLAEAAALNYSTAKSLFGATNHFFVFFEDREGKVLNLGICGFGALNVQNMSADICENVTINAQALVRTERLVYHNRAVKMVVYTFRI